MHCGVLVCSGLDGVDSAGVCVFDHAMLSIYRVDWVLVFVVHSFSCIYSTEVRGANSSDVIVHSVIHWVQCAIQQGTCNFIADQFFLSLRHSLIYSFIHSSVFSSLRKLVHRIIHRCIQVFIKQCCCIVRTAYYGRHSIDGCVWLAFGPIKCEEQLWCCEALARVWVCAVACVWRTRLQWSHAHPQTAQVLTWFITRIWLVVSAPVLCLVDHVQWQSQRFPLVPVYWQYRLDSWWMRLVFLLVCCVNAWPSIECTQGVTASLWSLTVASCGDMRDESSNVCGDRGVHQHRPPQRMKHTARISHNAIQYNAMQYNTIQYNTMQYFVIP
jgi:hypothetical protein